MERIPEGTSRDRENNSAGRRRLWRLAAGGVILATLVAFAYAASVVDHFPGEVAASTWVQSWRAGWLDGAMKAASIAGEVVVAGAIVLLVAIALTLKGRRAQGGLIIAATLVGYSIRTVLKVVVARPRPSADLVEVIGRADGYSFPSGHVMHYVVLLGTLAFVLTAAARSGVGRWLVRGSVVVILAFVGLSRIYLGVHWLGDVLAGYAIGALVVAGVVWAWRRWSGGRPDDSHSEEVS